MLCIGLWCACSYDSDTEPVLEIDMERLTLHFEAERAYQSITVSSDIAYTVTTSQPEWCVATIKNYAIHNLMVSVSKNETFENRHATVTISAPAASGFKDIEISVTQEGKKPVLSVNKKSIYLRRTGKQEFALDVYANFPLVFSLPDWITEKEGNRWENGIKTYTFNVAPLPENMSVRDVSIAVGPQNTAIEIQPVLVSVVQVETVIPKIIAHRGYWNCPGSAQNSIHSLEGSIALGLYGSEIDVYITADDVVVVNHDRSINGLLIESSNYEELMDIRLSNGEPLPLLQQFIDIIKNQDQTKLIIEIKPHSTATNEKRAVDAVLKLVEEGGTAHLVEYNSFSAYICDELIKANPQNRVAYLYGSRTPEQLKADGYWGFYYDMNILKNNTDWIRRARTLGLTSNVWTVNSISDIQLFVDLGIDFITTDNPLDCLYYLETFY